ncbi:MAG: BlaI/MecI/CopY family transcriptional regulator [Pseudomonadota bacterium]
MEPDLQLTDSEWDLMKILWEAAPASVNAIAERAQQTNQWHPKTVRTMLIRLDKKGLVNYSIRDGIQHYQPLFSREECESQATQSFLQRVFDGALTPMVAHFSSKRKLTPEEKRALLALLNDSETAAGDEK